MLYPLFCFFADSGIKILGSVFLLLSIVLFAASSFRSGEYVKGWTIILIAVMPILMTGALLAIWATLHGLLILQRRERRAVVASEGWLAIAVAAAVILLYSALYFLIPSKGRPRITIPPLLALCPIILLFLAGNAGPVVRVLFRLLALIAAGIAVLALWAAFRGNREIQGNFLALSGTITLLSDFMLSRIERRHTRKARLTAASLQTDKPGLRATASPSDTGH
jgi:hypothetical protein